MLGIRCLIRLCSLILLMSKCCHSYIDMFIDAKETSTLIGMPGSFFYVFNGELRQNSITYQLEIPEFKNEVTINWKASNLVNYKFKIWDTHSPTKRLHNLSIPTNGFVPNTLSNFSIKFDCSSLNRSEMKPHGIDLKFMVYLKLNNTLATGFEQLITMPPLNFTISYHKLCVKQSRHLKSRSGKTSDYLMAYVIIGGLGGFALFILLVAAGMCIHNKIKAKQKHAKYVSLHSKLNAAQHQLLSEQLKNKIYSKGHAQPQQASAVKCVNSEPNRGVEAEQMPANGSSSEETNIYESVQEASCVNLTINQEVVSREVSKRPTVDDSRRRNKLMLNLTTNTIQSVYTHNNSMSNNTLTQHYSKRNNIDQCVKFKASQIEQLAVLMEGTFSKILTGKLSTSQADTEASISENGPAEAVNVLIKVVGEQASVEQTDLMLKESCSFRGLKHKNLSSILGVCFQMDKKPMTLFPYCELGNLKIYLSSLRLKNTKLNKHGANLANQSSFSEHPLISTQELLFIILQMFKAINYLHTKHVLHKDIAARNCWLDSNFSLKLSDCALSRDLFPDDYHCLANSENKPICWMALESLNNNVNNVRTEIWSCGVFLWECFNLGAQPYAHIDPFELADYLGEDEANRLAKPVNCPSELYDVYKKCWDSDPAKRPTLKEVFYSLHKYYSTLDNYV